MASRLTAGVVVVGAVAVSVFNVRHRLQRTLSRLLQTPRWAFPTSRRQKGILSKRAASTVDLSKSNLSEGAELLATIEEAAQCPDPIGELNLSGNLLCAIPELPPSFHGLRKLSLSGNKLTELPVEIGKLESLAELDVGRNSLTSVPPEVGRLSNLVGLNLMCNRLKELPREVGRLRKLERLGLKGNLLVHLPPEIGNLKSLKELYLSDNRLVALPRAMGRLKELVKVQLSWNRLAALPAEMGSLPNLELMRVAVNNIESIPESFSLLPKLAWFSLASNPASKQPTHTRPLASIEHMEYSSLPVVKQIGAGASGEVFLSERRGQRVAVKVFKSEVSPDGHSSDEIDITVCLDHPNLTRVLGKADVPLSLVLKHINGSALADRPDSKSLLRCRWAPGLKFTVPGAVGIARNVASALCYLHSKGICHGDVYAHNIIATESGQAVICDFGASFFYGDEPGHGLWEPMEVRGFGLLLSDLTDRLDCQPTHPAAVSLRQLVAECVGAVPAARPSFAHAEERLKGIHC